MSRVVRNQTFLCTGVSRTTGVACCLCSMENNASHFLHLGCINSLKAPLIQRKESPNKGIAEKKESTSLDYLPATSIAHSTAHLPRPLKLLLLVEFGIHLWSPSLQGLPRRSGYPHCGRRLQSSPNVDVNRSRRKLENCTLGSWS